MQPGKIHIEEKAAFWIRFHKTLTTSQQARIVWFWGYTIGSWQSLLCLSFPGSNASFRLLPKRINVEEAKRSDVSAFRVSEQLCFKVARWKMEEELFNQGKPIFRQHTVLMVLKLQKLPWLVYFRTSWQKLCIMFGRE